MREAYVHLRKYYEDQNDIENQLYVTNQMLALNKQFEQEQHTISNTMHYKLENQALEEAKSQLELALDKASRNQSVYISIGIVTVMVLVFMLIWNIRIKNKWKKQMDLWMEKSESLSHLLLDVPKVNTTQTAAKLTKIEKQVLEALSKFEEEKAFLQPLKLQDLADQLKVNRNTLSKIIQKHREKRASDYLGFLRTRELLKDMRNNSELMLYTQESLAENYGFGSVKTLCRQFKENANMSLGFFLKEVGEKRKNQATLI